MALADLGPALKTLKALIEVILVAVPFIVPGYLTVKVLRRYGLQRPFVSLALHFLVIPLHIVTFLMAIAYIPYSGRPTMFTVLILIGLVLLALSLVIVGADLLDVGRRAKPSTKIVDR